MTIKYLEGLNGLRALLATLVILRHGWQSVDKLGLVQGQAMPFLFVRGMAAVDFFFTLSGFLITYLLLQEKATTGTISLRRFYLRRIYRIWPPYFVVVIIGFLFFGVVYPRLFGSRYFDFDIGQGLLLYIFFLSNLASSFFRTGLMHPLWSIGVEEQFYLVWAPVMKWAGSRTLLAVAIFVLATTAFHVIFQGEFFFWSEPMEEFLGTLRYHYMAIGSLTALVLFNWGEAYCRSFVANRWAQGVVFSLIVSYYCFHLPIPDLGIAVLYGLAILSLSVAPKRLLNLEWEPLVYLGKVSYGLYIYHMLADYPLRLAFAKLHLVNTPNDFLAAGYCIILVFFTILIAHISYRYFESPFLRLGHSSTKPSPFRGDPSSSVQASAIK